MSSFGDSNIFLKSKSGIYNFCQNSTSSAKYAVDFYCFASTTDLYTNPRIWVSCLQGHMLAALMHVVCCKAAGKDGQHLPLIGRTSTSPRSARVLDLHRGQTLSNECPCNNRLRERERDRAHKTYLKRRRICQAYLIIKKSSITQKNFRTFSKSYS